MTFTKMGKEMEMEGNTQILGLVAFGVACSWDVGRGMVTRPQAHMDLRLRCALEDRKKQGDKVRLGFSAT